MKDKVKGFIFGTVTALAFSSVSVAFATDAAQSIQVYFNMITLKVNNVTASGNNILYEGTTYVPIRNVSEILGKEIQWDDKTKIVSIVDKKAVEITKIQPLTTNESDFRYISNYTKLIKYGDKTYDFDFPLFLRADRNNNVYVSSGDSALHLISLSYGEYKQSGSQNPYVNGRISPTESANNYIKRTTKYTSVNSMYFEYEYYNKDKSKTYFDITKPGEEKGNIKVGYDNLIPMADLFKQLELKYNVEIDDAKKIVTISF